MRRRCTGGAHGRGRNLPLRHRAAPASHERSARDHCPQCQTATPPSRLNGCLARVAYIETLEYVNRDHQQAIRRGESPIPMPRRALVQGLRFVQDLPRRKIPERLLARVPACQRLEALRVSDRQRCRAIRLKSRRRAILQPVCLLRRAFLSRFPLRRRYPAGRQETRVFPVELEQERHALGVVPEISFAVGGIHRRVEFVMGSHQPIATKRTIHLLRNRTFLFTPDSNCCGLARPCAYPGSSVLLRL